MLSSVGEGVNSVKKEKLNKKKVQQILSPVEKSGKNWDSTLSAAEKSMEILKPYIRSEGDKFDGEKLRYDLLPVDALEEITKVFTMGAKKYGDRNWEKGITWGRIFAALLRHLFAFWVGEDYDKESGLLHTSHMAWNAVALLTYQKRKIGVDDRVKIKGV